jgi:membrane fusion protein, macrolide-specific efflux system
MKTTKQHLIKFILLMLVFTLLLSACADNGFSLGMTEPTVTPIPAQPVAIRKPTYEVQRGDIVRNQLLIGRIGPVTTVTVEFAANGRIGALNFSEGDMVEAGDLIAYFDYLPELERETTLREISIRRAEIAVERAEMFLEAAEADDNPSPTTIQDKEWDLELAQLAYDELMIYMGEQLASVDAAKIVAPMSGMITELRFRFGQNVNEFTPALTIADISETALLVDSYATNIEELYEGMPVSIRLFNSTDEPFTGYIRQMPFPYGTGPGRDEDKWIYVEFDNPEDAKQFQLNDRFDIIAETARADDVLWLPPEAIRTFSGRVFVMIEEDALQRSIDIKTGIDNGEMIEITEGLEEGQIVVGQ